MDKQMDKWTRDDSKDRADASKTTSNSVNVLLLRLSNKHLLTYLLTYCSAQYILALASQSFREGYR